MAGDRTVIIVAVGSRNWDTRRMISSNAYLFNKVFKPTGLLVAVDDGYGKGPI